MIAPRGNALRPHQCGVDCFHSRVQKSCAHASSVSCCATRSSGTEEVSAGNLANMARTKNVKLCGVTWRLAWLLLFRGG